MPFQPGHKPMGGRPKGAVGKKTRTIMEMLEQSEKNPIEVMLEMLAGPDKGLALAAAKELAQYYYPKRRALELDANVNLKAAEKVGEFEQLPKEQQIALLEAEAKRLKET